MTSQCYLVTVLWPQGKRYTWILPLEDSTFVSNVEHLCSPLRPGACQPALNANIVNNLRKDDWGEIEGSMMKVNRNILREVE